MRLIGLKDKHFGDMGDFTGEVIIPLDFNAVVPLLQKKPVDSFSICSESLEELFDLFKKELDDEKVSFSALILMRVKSEYATNEHAATYGRKMSSLFSKDSIVVWAAQEYNTFRFDVYLYSLE